MALLLAGRATENDQWKHEASCVAMEVAGRPGIGALVIDSGLCHGAAAVAHLFNRMFQSTGENVFKIAARTWFAKTLRMRRGSESVAGFFAMQKCRNGTWKAVAELGIVRGAAGVALALLAGATPVEPAWDRMLLVSLRERLSGAS
jgi:hypothetical protein